MRQNEHIDNRKLNGRCTLEISDIFNSQNTLQEWSGKTADNHVAIIIDERFGLDLEVSTLRKFHHQVQSFQLPIE